jgi:ubiquinone/menaquinone biosynthesis C-methylase UbiE
MTSSPTPEPDFNARAARYDELRPQDEHWWELYELLVREGDLAGRRVLDIGCGTGRFAAALGHKANVWGIDASAEMLAVARTRVPRTVRLKQAKAERPPFRDGWFDRTVYWLVIHLLDRPAAFAAARRLLDHDGRACIATFDPAHFDHYWANRFFPSMERLDRERFPTEDELEQELKGAGFSSVRMLAHVQRDSIGRDEALLKLRGKHISTFDLLDPSEYQQGLEQAEAELPQQVDTSLYWLLCFAER